MKHKLINCNLIVHNLIVHFHNLLVYYPEAVAHWCSVAVLKNQKQPLVNVLQKGLQYSEESTCVGVSF